MLSRRQTIDEVGRGLVSKDNQLMKLLNHDMCHNVTCHVMIVMSKMADDKDANAFMLLYFLTAKQHEKRTMWVCRWLIDW